MAPKPLIHAELCREIGNFTDTRKIEILENYTSEGGVSNGCLSW